MPRIYPEQMKSKSFIFLLNIFLAILIYANAEAGRLLGIMNQPLNVSLVWPSTGFSLAALLLFGFKTLPGVFLGNFCYNALHLVAYKGSPLFPSIATALLVTVGSTLQAYVGGFIMRRYTSFRYFQSAKDMVIFFLGGGILTCLIASTIGVIALYHYGTFSSNMLWYFWSTFWIGDTLGIYIVTPLIVVWSLKKFTLPLKSYLGELIGMVIAFFLISIGEYRFDYPLWFLYIPLALWTTYRFQALGSTILVLLIALVSVIGVSYGHGFSYSAYPFYYPLFLLVQRLMITVVVSLFLAGTIYQYKGAT